MRSLTIVQKFLVLGGAGLVAALATGGAGLYGMRQYQALAASAQDGTTARMLIRELDTRASELKVDGYKALVRVDPEGEREEFVEDATKITTRLDALAALDLPAEETAQVAVVTREFTSYIDQIDAFLTRAETDQVAARADWETIQTANDATDEAVGTAVDLFDEVAAATAQEQAAVTQRLTYLIVATLVVGAVSVTALALGLSRGVRRRVEGMTQVLRLAAEGDLTVRSGAEGTDEVAGMGASVDALLARLRGLLTTLEETARGLDVASQQVEDVSGGVASTQQSASAQARAVAESADEVSSTVQSVAAGAQEMGASIGEIARNAQEAAEVATGAVGAVETTTSTMQKLGDSSREIGDVIRLITSIAEQTNLLALNATIEAARAGDAGKGFAVVADEVKQLAQETARATEDISRRVQAIQDDAERATDSIGGIATVINRIHEYQTAIAGAVEEQTATTHDMNTGIGVAADGSVRIAESVTRMARTAAETADSMSATSRSAEELRRMSEALMTSVKGFRY